MYPAMDETKSLPPTAPPIPAPPPPPLSLPPPQALMSNPIVMGPTVPGPVNPTVNGMQTQTRVPAPWSTGLFDCYNDVDNCCMTCFCPCITFGQIAEIVDRGSVSCCASGALYSGIMYLTGCHCVYSCFYRSKMRGQFFLEESPCADCCVHCLCEPCALCQEYRELRHRGLDPYFGWNGNLARQVAMMPPSVGGMTR